jgi:hypothetical protein
VNHLHIMACTVFADVGGARHAARDGLAGLGAGDGLAGLGVDFGGDGFPDGLQFFPSGELATGHERWAEARAFFTAGDAGADEAEALFLEILFAADRVGPEGVTAVDDDVALFEEGNEAVDDCVGRFAGLHEDHHLAGLGQGLDEFLERLGADEAAGRVGVFGDKLVGFFDRAVVDRDLKAVVGDVEGEVLTHHGEADESDVRVGFRHKRVSN